MIVADASPLIALAKLGRLTLLRDLYGKVLIGSTVEAETVTAGRAVRALGVEQIEAAMADGWLQTTRLSTQEDGLMQRFMAYSRLHRGEAESIALANARGLPLIVDDKAARAVAAMGSVAHVGTAGVLLEACLRRRLELGGIGGRPSGSHSDPVAVPSRRGRSTEARAGGTTMKQDRMA